MSLLQTILQGFSPGGIQGFQGRQADIDSEKQLTRQRAEKADQDAFAHAMTEGYLPVGPGGVVRRPAYDSGANFGSSPTGDLPAGVPGAQTTLPPSGGSYIDKADTSRVITHTDANGDKVQWEIPTPEEQFSRQANMAYAQAMNPAARQAQQVQQQRTAAGTASESAARTQGAATGATAGKVNDLAQRGVNLNDDLADAVGIPRGTKLLPEERDAITEKYNTVRGAQVRSDGATDRQQASIAAKASGVKSTHVTVGKDGGQSLLTVYNNGETEETPMDAKAAVKPTAAGKNGSLTPGQQGVMNRFQIKQQELQAANHEKLQSKEGDLWSLKQAYADAAQTPDDQLVVDPGNPRAQPTAMNAAWRTIFSGRMKKAEGDAMQAQKSAAQIRKQNGWGEFAPGQQPTASSTPPATQAAAGGAGAPVAAAPAASTLPAPAPAANPTAVAAPAQKVHVKTAKGMGYIPKANLAAAQKLDPTLQVIP